MIKQVGLLRYAIGWCLISIGLALILIMVPATYVEISDGDFFATGVGLLVLVFGYQLVEFGYYQGTGEAFPYAISTDRAIFGRRFDKDLD